MAATRRASILAVLGTLAGCGGGAYTPMSGTEQTKSIAAHSNGTTYPLNIYLPAGGDAARANAATVYLLDGDSRFQAVVDIVEANRANVIIVGIANELLRGRDYVPENICTTGGGGQAAYLAFIVGELIPFIESTYGGNPAQRILLGHSHGGSFVLYALFAETNANRHFSAYLASDASIDCMSATVYGWESAFAAASTSLPVRLHISYSANTANAAFAQQIQSRHYSGLSLVAQLYAGGHIGMIPAAFADAMAFALA